MSYCPSYPPGRCHIAPNIPRADVWHASAWRWCLTPYTLIYGWEYGLLVLGLGSHCLLPSFITPCGRVWTLGTKCDMVIVRLDTTPCRSVWVRGVTWKAGVTCACVQLVEHGACNARVVVFDSHGGPVWRREKSMECMHSLLYDALDKSIC